jgi:hypothetical protein
MEIPIPTEPAELRTAGTTLNEEQRNYLAYHNPSNEAVAAWLTHNGLTAAPNTVVKVTVNGKDEYMGLNPIDFGTTIVPGSGRTVEDELQARHLSISTVLA